MDWIRDAAPPDFAGVPLVPGMAGAFGRIRDDLVLAEEERASIVRGSARRKREFATGRALARRALEDAGFPPAPLPKGASGAPSWPEGSTGSISHTRDWAAAVVASAAVATSLGIDIERPDRITDRIAARTLTARERARPDAMRSAGFAFSAKESVFKAVNPLSGCYIAFHDAEICLDWEAGTFKALHVGNERANAIMNRGLGRFTRFAGAVFTLFWIPA